MECLLCSRADSSVFERSGLLMCKACYDAGVAADMAVARVYRFEPADHVADNIFLGPEGAAAAPTPPTPEPAAERSKFQRVS